MSRGRLAIERDIEAGILARVYVNDTDVGVIKRGDWDAAMALICDYAVDMHGEDIHHNNAIGRRALCLDAFAQTFGVEHFPMLTKDNSEITERGMEIRITAALPMGGPR